MNTKMIKLTLIALLLTLSTFSQAVSVTVNGSGSTFVINKNGGFDGADGIKREAAFVAAVQVWADILVSPVDIVIDASFSSALYCDTNSATLGSAGPLSTYFMSGADSFGLQNNVWYPTALINAHYGSDYFNGSADISAQFNADLGDANCLASGGWYYEMDGNTPAGYIDFYEVVLHELGHGLGILSLVNLDGSNNSGVIDIFTTFLKDQSTSKSWSAMSNAERNASVVNDGGVVWNGAAVTALSANLNAGVNNGKVQMYAPNPYQSGSSISHFDTDLSPNELMEPQYTGDASHDHSTALLQDIGWTIYETNNETPVITGQSNLATNEDSSISLTLTDLTVNDSDSSFPADFTLNVSTGSNYTVSGNTVTPSANFNGLLSIPVTVNDGYDTSASYSLSVTVNSVNDKPVISSQSALSINEDSNLTLATSMLTITDPDDSTFSLNVGSGTNYSVTGNAIYPAANFNGTLTIPVTVNDGEIDSDSFNLSVAVAALNDAPTISATPTVSFDEDTNHTFVVGDFSISDPDDNAFSLTIVAGANYSVTGNSITPSANFNGTLSVGAYVNDGQANSSTESFNVTVTAINDAPTISGSPSTQVTYPNSYSASFSATDADNNTLTYSVTSSHAWLSINNAGLLIGTPSASDIGTESVSVTVSDGALSDSYNFNLTVADASSADLTPAINTSEQIVDLNTSTVIAVSAVNNGPKTSADGYLLVNVDANTNINSIPTDCSFNTATQVRCDFTNVLTSKPFNLTVSKNNAGTDNISVEIFGSQTDPDDTNNWQDFTVIFQNDQSAPPQSASVLPTQNTLAAAFGDLDGDTKKEVVFANDLDTPEYGYEFNNSYNALTQSQQFSSNSNASEVLVLDLNNDQLNDVVLANIGANSVYLNQGNGTFGSEISLGSADSHGVVATDINNDGYIDLIFANSGPNQIYLNNQANGFTAEEIFGNAQSSDLDIIDFNNDGYPDIIVANTDDSDLVYLNAGSDQSSGILSGSPVLISSADTISHAVIVADMNGDEVHNEFFIARSTGVNIASLELFEVNSNVVSSINSINAGDIVSMDIADYDGNDQLDIIALSRQGSVQLFTQNNSVYNREYTFKREHASNVTMQEMNGDDLADIVITQNELAPSQFFISDVIFVPSTDEGSNSDNDEETDSETTPSTEPDTDSDQTTTVVVVKSSGSLDFSLLMLAILLLSKRLTAKSNRVS